MLKVVILFGFIASVSSLTVPHQQVTSILVEPFLMLKGDHASFEGNDKYEGFSKDLADMLSTRLNFTYTLNFVPSNKHGRFIHGRWTGIMGELLEDGGADMAISPLTITKDRRRVVDFSTPFLDFQLALITRKPGFDAEGNRAHANKTDLIKTAFNQRSIFLQPFTSYLWIILLNTFIVLALIYFTIEFFISQKRSEPSNSGKALRTIYWKFMTLILISYSASFTNVRMIESHKENHQSTSSIKSLSDLVAQTEVHYGVIRAGSSFDYFRLSQDWIHKKIYSVMTGERVTSLPLTIEDGVARVRFGLQPYALIVESPYAEYHSTLEPCNIDVAPKYFGPHKSYAVATTPNHTLTALINIQIVSMKDNGELYNLEQKWLQTKTPICEAIDKEQPTEEAKRPLLQLGPEELWIPFFLVAITLIFAPLIAITEIHLAGKTNVNPKRHGKKEEALEMEVDKMQLTHFDWVLFTFISTTWFSISLAQSSKPIVVISILVEPFLMILDDSTLQGNERYEGFSKDFADKLFQKLGIPYVLKTDTMYGTKNDDGKWNGMIGALNSGEADMAIADLTITVSRSEVIEFSVPFMQAQLAILMKKPEPIEPTLNEDMLILLARQFSKSLWFLIVGSLLMFLIFIFILDKCMTRKVSKIYPKWIPRSMSVMCLQFSLVTFILVIVTIFTSNFIASKVTTIILESRKTAPPLPFNSANQLVEKEDMKYGILQHGSTYNYFQSTMFDDLVEKMFRKMAADKTFVSSYQQGIQRVRNSNGSFAFIMESHAAKFATIRKPCDVTVAPELFGPKKGFSVAIPKGSTTISLKDIDLAVLDMNEQGVLTDMENKWFADQTECDDTDGRNDIPMDKFSFQPVSLLEFKTPFMLLGGAVGAIVLFAFLEYFFLGKCDR